MMTLYKSKRPMLLKYIPLLSLPLFLISCGNDVEYEKYKIDESNTVLDCKGKKLNKGKPTEVIIKSPEGKQITNITIKNCHITGSIRTIGLGRNGESKGVKKSSHKDGHTERAQDAAPTDVTLDNLTITGVGRIPIYLGPGTTDVEIKNTHIKGETNSTVIYLDAESADNYIHHNKFDVKGNWTARQFRVREVIAVDGSANNIISNNEFQNVPGGGIYLYRNCGEGGTVRHQKPKNNYIVDNEFDLGNLSLGNYGIFLGAREGKRFYCDEDKGYPYGSSVSDLDHANGNILKDNKFSGSDREIKDRGKNNVID